MGGVAVDWSLGSSTSATPFSASEVGRFTTGNVGALAHGLAGEKYGGDRTFVDSASVTIIGLGGGSGADTEGSGG